MKMEDLDDSWPLMKSFAIPHVAMVVYLIQ